MNDATCPIGRAGRAGRRPWTHRSRLRSVAVITVLVVLVSACNPVFGDDAGEVRRYVMSRSSDLSYLYAGNMDALTVLNAAPFPAGNIREFFWDTDTPYTADQQTCMTWQTTADSSDTTNVDTQPGMALRIAPGPDGKGLRAISIDQNVWAAATWVIWVLLWESDGTDTRDGTDHTFTGHVSFDASAVVGKRRRQDGVLQSSMAPPPWHVCARTLGDDLTFKIWTGTNPEPAWDDPIHTFTTTLPADWNQSGYSGGYIGHLGENSTATFTDFSTFPTCLAPDLIDTPRCQTALDSLTTDDPGT